MSGHGHIRFILASASPARRQTLLRAGVEPEVIVSNFDEDSITQETTFLLVTSLAFWKAQTVLDQVSGRALVLGCDSLLEFEGESLGKPGTYEEAVARWRRMRGKSGVLHTGHVLMDGRVTGSATVSTGVHFADLTDAEIEAYCRTGEPQNVAGGFTIDGLGGWFIERVEGDPHNVVGLSLPALRGLLTQMNYSLADLGYPAP